MAAAVGSGSGPTAQLTDVTPPDGNSLHTRHFGYDSYARQTTFTNGNNVTVTSSYDNLDRITKQTYSDATHEVDYAYDADGGLKTRTDASGTTSYTRDALGRLTGKTNVGGPAMYNLSYGYDPQGNLTSLTDGRGTTGYHYDKLNLLDQVTEAGSGHTDVFGYNDDHKRTGTWYATSGANAGGSNGPTHDSSGNVLQVPAGFAGHIATSLDKDGKVTELKTTSASSDADSARVSDLQYCYSSGQGSDSHTCSTAKGTAGAMLEICGSASRSG